MINKKWEEKRIKYEEWKDYFIGNTKERVKTIDSINDLYLLLYFLNENPHTHGKNKWIFRGQSNEMKDGKFKEWKLESSLKRKFKNEGKQNDVSVLNMATNGVIKHINDNSPSNKDGLEILSEMQHYDNPTLLIDFTFDILQALWFSFHTNNFYSENEGYVTLYIKEIDDSKIKCKINEDDIKDYDIKDYNNSSPLKCPNTINRGISQRSIFILDNESNYENFSQKFKKINISYKPKNEILEFLKSKGVESKYVFPDNKGLYLDFFDNNIHTLFIEGNSLREKGMFVEAIKMYEKWFSGDDEDKYYPDVVYSNWGTALVGNGDFSKACKKFEEAIEINGNNVELYCNLGIALGKKGDFSQACKKFEEAIRIDPNDAETYYSWGVVLGEKGDFSKSCDKFKEAINFKPDFAEAYYSWGTSLAMMGEFVKSCNKFKEAIHFKPNFSDAYHNWGTSLVRMDEISEARDKFKKAISIDPNNVEALHFLNEIKETK